MFQEIAPQCRTSTGQTGEIPESLANNTDATWISNMIRFVYQQIAHVVSKPTPETPEIPV